MCSSETLTNGNGKHPPARTSRGCYFLSPAAHDRIYGPGQREAIAKLVQVESPLITAKNWPAHRDALEQVELLFSGWGLPRMDDEVLDVLPRLQAIFYGAGSVKTWETEALWERGITVVSAHAANAVPVADFALAQILLSLKHAWKYMLAMREHREWVRCDHQMPGIREATIGLVSLGTIGRLVRERLRPYPMRVLAYDPYVTDEEADALEVEMASLDEIFRECDAISLHTPLLAETRHLIRGYHLESMKCGATLINTARGSIVHETEMIDALIRRPEIFAVLDVTDPEPPDQGSPLFFLPNVILTPHLAGSVGPECRALGELIVSELRRYLRGEALRHAITRECAARMA